MHLVSLPGVFRPIGESHLLAEVVRAQTLTPRSTVLDLCTGSGIIAVTAARRGVRSVTAVDVSRRAVATARLNAKINDVRVDVHRGDLFEVVGDRRFDLVVANPPYVPVPDLAAPRGAARAWAAGHDGRLVLNRIIEGLPRHLRPGGVALIAHSSIVGAEQTLQALEDAGMQAAVVARRTYDFGPVLTAQAKALEDARFVRPGQRHEEVLIFRARRASPVQRPAVVAIDEQPALT